MFNCEEKTYVFNCEEKTHVFNFEENTQVFISRLPDVAQIGLNCPFADQLAGRARGRGGGFSTNPLRISANPC